MNRRIFTFVAMMAMVVGIMAGPALAAPATLTAESRNCGEVTVTLANPNNYALIADFGFGDPAVERDYSDDLLTEGGPYLDDPPSEFGLYYAEEPTGVNDDQTSDNGASFMAINGENSQTLEIPEDEGGGEVAVTYRVKSGAEQSEYILPETIFVDTDCEPNVPTTKEDCKDGGWQVLVDDNGDGFRNQGQCIQFVNTGK